MTELKTPSQHLSKSLLLAMGTQTKTNRQWAKLNYTIEKDKQSQKTYNFTDEESILLRKKLEDLSSNEGLYDSLTCYLTLVCCVLYLPLALGERTVFSVYFLTLFNTAWSTVILYCIQEGCWHTFYICLGWSGKIRYRKGMERTVSFNKMIQCMEFDDSQVSPGPMKSKITFVDSITRQELAHEISS